MAVQKLIAAVGVDLSAANYLNAILAVALRKGHRVMSILNAMPKGISFFKTDPRPDVLLTGMSSPISLFGHEQELEHGAQAAKLDVPWFVFADTYRSWARPPAAGKVGNATVVVASPLEVDEAVAFGYQDAEFLGGPPHWQAWGSVKPIVPTPGLTIYASGIKSHDITDEFLSVVVRGMNAARGNDWRLIFRPHPNECEEKPQDRAHAAEWRDRRQRILAGVKVLDQHPLADTASEAEVIASVNVSFFTSGAAGVPCAAALRRPVAYYDSPTVRARMTSQIGTESWFPIDRGAAWVIENPDAVGGVLQKAADAEERKALERRQRALLPDFPREPIAEKILEHVLQFVG